ncbi:L,D-transpeptidase family protein [Brevibacterium yomogidense]|uniref:L,D-transpeptidase family protein n=1 Tax=Brevibacterium yomogidense TaxID=946573 RepID=UPI0018E009D9|nr:L,D-transpeptidase family protein [Brevibacterium yomogidense]
MTRSHTGTAHHGARSAARGTSILLAGALVVSALALAPPGAHAATASDDSAASFTAPAQRGIVQFDAPRQRIPAPLGDPAAGGADDTSTGAHGNADGSDGGAAEAVSDLADPATGLGPATAGRIPDGTEQVLVASGADDDATRTALALWEEDDGTWRRTVTMTGRNGANGWKQDRHEGDRTTPAGVFSLSDAGGYLPDPGSQLPYHRDEGLRSGAEAVYGDGYASVFDYVIAIDYNRKTGVAPTENTRPDGWDAGGKIWLHVEHGSPTRGCIALPEDDMETLLTTLDPDRSPHIAMGSEEFLAQ